MRGVWQALNCLSIDATYCVIVARASPGEKCGLRYVKTAIFCTCGSNNWEIVEDRWVHAARGLTSVELSFHPCNILRDNRRGVSRRNKNVGCGTWKQQFLPRDAMHKRGVCRHPVSVCLSVTFVSCAKTNKDMFEIFSPSGSQAILVFPYQTECRYSNGNPLNGGVECKGVWKNWRFSTNISLYLRNGYS